MTEKAIKVVYVHVQSESSSSAANQHSVHLTGGYVPRFQAVFLAQANSAKMALPCPARQQVTHTVGCFFDE